MRILPTRARGAHVLLCVALLGLPFLAVAHGLRVAAQADVDAVRGQARYSDGSPAVEAFVSIFQGQAAEPLATGQTDAEGRFRFGVKQADTYRIVVGGEEGHRAEASVAWTPPGAIAGGQAGTVSAEAVATAVRTELLPLRDDIARLERRIWFAEVVGSIGILIGLAGANAWWRARRGR